MRFNRKVRANNSHGYTKEPVTFSEIGDVRYLHFGTPWVQGAMNIRHPNKLELEYARMMMAYLLFMEEPRAVAQMGMGCASLTKFTHAYLKRTHSTVVELNPDVISACYGMFRLPVDDRIEVVLADAAIWIAEQNQHYAALQIDLYDASARGPVCDTEEFYGHCHRALKSEGIATINLFGDHPSFVHNMQNLKTAFAGRVLALPEIHDGNRIAMAFKGAPIQIGWAQLYERAETIEQIYELPAKRWVSGLKSVHPGDEFII
jgi:spermidine synthase